MTKEEYMALPPHDPIAHSCKPASQDGYRKECRRCRFVFGKQSNKLKPRFSIIRAALNRMEAAKLSEETP